MIAGTFRGQGGGLAQVRGVGASLEIAEQKNTKGRPVLGVQQLLITSQNSIATHARFLKAAKKQNAKLMGRNGNGQHLRHAELSHFS